MHIDIFLLAWPAIATWIHENNRRMQQETKLLQFRRKIQNLIVQTIFDEWYLIIPPDRWQQRFYLALPVSPSPILHLPWLDPDAWQDLIMFFQHMSQGSEEVLDDAEPASLRESLLAIEDYERESGESSGIEESTNSIPPLGDDWFDFAVWEP